MCTLTWWREDSHYALLFNRDEQKTRLPAAPPEVRTSAGVRFITPIDGNRGGTWIIANEFGISVALLNYYDAAIDAKALPKKSPSRGKLVLSLAPSRDLDAVGSALEREKLDPYWPFHLFAIAPGTQPRLWTWAGPGRQLLLQESPAPPVTTSSFRTTEVCSRRAERFHEITAGSVTPPTLAKFHDSVEPEDGAFSVRLRRSDAQTLSLSHIAVDEGSVRFDYRPDTIDSLDLNKTVTTSLPLHRPSA